MSPQGAPREQHPAVEALSIVVGGCVRVVSAITDRRVVVPVVSILVFGHVIEVALVGERATLLDRRAGGEFWEISNMLSRRLCMP